MNTPEKVIKVALADDHIVLRDALANLINTYENCQVVFTASNGQEVIDKIESGLIPQVMILDLTMPVKDGHETMVWLNKHHPNIHTLMLTMYDADLTLIRMLKAGVKGFLKKDIHPDELKLAIKSVNEFGYYYPHSITGKVVNMFRNSLDDTTISKNGLTDPEVDFLKLCCSEKTYKEIAQAMNTTQRNVDAIRDTMFTKLGVKSRVGLAIFAVKHGLVSF